ncbi:hypothetical protein [Streptacidiphilus sp. EB129]|uniref:hypothetical protein n=1 Tax=Streptacidiphilus sp. EB129 TaxID=3156262 RepID=UPI0035183B03
MLVGTIGLVGDLRGRHSRHGHGLLLADGLLLLLDASGREGFVETARAQGVAEVREAIALAQASAHPDREGLARLQALANGPLSRGAAARRARAKRTGRRPGR